VPKMEQIGPAGPARQSGRTYCSDTVYFLLFNVLVYNVVVYSQSPMMRYIAPMTMSKPQHHHHHQLQQQQQQPGSLHDVSSSRSITPHPYTINASHRHTPPAAQVL